MADDFEEDAAPIGHNSGVHVLARDELRSFVERIERLTEEKQAIAGDITDVYGEAKGRGYDTRTIKAVIARRKKDAKELAEQEAMLETYLHALGMI